MENYAIIQYDTDRGIRYCIASTETGEVLDDAQGWGYKSAQKALAGWKYKVQVFGIENIK